MQKTAPLLLLLLLITATACGRESSKDTTATSASSSSSSSTWSGEVTVGKPAPDFTSTAHDGTPISIAGSKGKNVVLYFYPKDETAGCTKEACSFRDSWKELEAAGVVLVGISTDDAESHKKFAEHHKLPFHLLSDTDGKIAKAYGVGNTAGFLSRHTIVIGKDGNVKKIYRSVDVTKHASEILADVKS